MIYIKDKLTIDASKKKVTIARDGIYKYLGEEIGIPGDMNIYNVMRSTESCTTVRDKINEHGCIPVTIEHPKNFVNLDDTKSFKRGGVGKCELSVKDGCNVVEGEMVGLSADVKDLIDQGSEVSLGSRAEIRKVENPEYSFIMDVTDVNHVAIVANGRCGTTCKIKDADFKKLIMEELSMELKQKNADLQAEKEVLEAKLADAEAKLEETKSEAVAEEEVIVEAEKTEETVEATDAETEKTEEVAETEEAKEESAAKEQELVDKGIDMAFQKGQIALKFVDAGHLKAADLIGKKPCEVIDTKLKEIFGLEEVSDSDRTGLISLALKPQVKDGWNNWGVKTEDKKASKEGKSILGRMFK